MIRRLLRAFVLTFTAVVVLLWAYLAWRLEARGGWRLLLATPFVLVWCVPIFYWDWVFDRNTDTQADELLHAAAYLSIGWINFAVVLSLLRDAWLLLTTAAGAQAVWRPGPECVLAGSFIALALGMLAALRGPRVRRVDVPVQRLDPRLDGLRIVQISDLHVGPTLGLRYVRRVVRLALALEADLFALTGDIVDGPVERLRHKLAPVAELARARPAFLVMGNHDYYAGARPWIECFRSLGLRVLLNEHALLHPRGAPLVVGGVVDPAAYLDDPKARPQPELASAPEAGPAFRLLLAHNPRLAPLGEQAGFDLQLSGHTHAGQFFPWTLAVRLVHAPHVAGLGRRGRMWVYVNSGTGSWGPPIRFGSEPELTLLRLVRAG